MLLHTQLSDNNGKATVLDCQHTHTPVLLRRTGSGAAVALHQQRRVRQTWLLLLLLRPAGAAA
jgi:hypothetical protein